MFFLSTKKYMYYLYIRVMTVMYSMVYMDCGMHGLINYIDAIAQCRHLKKWHEKRFCGR
jgi:hypothetical protein